MTQLRIWLDVQITGTTTGEGPIVEVESFASRARLNRAGDWTATLPATDPRAAELLTPRRSVLAYAMINNTPTLIGAGVIDTLTTQLRDDGETLVVAGRDLIEELSRLTVGDVTLIESGLENFLNNNIPTGWAYTLTGTAPSFMARFSYENLLGCLTALTDKLPLWFRRRTLNGNPRHVDVLTSLPNNQTLLAVISGDPQAMESNTDVGLIQEITEIRQAVDVISRLYAFGAGNAAARLSMSAATMWPNGTTLANPYIINNNTLMFDRAANLIINQTAETAYGRVERAAAWKDISPLSNTDADVIGAANTLVAAAVEHLRRNRAPAYEYTLSVAGVRKDLLPGDLIRVQARRTRDGAIPIAIDADVRVLEVATMVDAAGVRVDGLTVATVDHWPVTDMEMIVAEMRQSMVMERLPQQGPSIDTIVYDEPIDDNASAALRFWLGDETTLVNQILLRFKANPFRSTAKTIGGTVSATVDIPNHTHSVTLADHTHSVTLADHTHNVPNHQHYIMISGGTDPTYNIGFSAAGTAGGLYHNASSSNFNLPTNADSGGTTTESGGGTTVTSGAGGGTTVTSADGGGQTGLEINLVNALTLEYGIHEDTAGNTYAATDLEFLVNGNLVIQVATAQSDGWYVLDLTGYIINTGTLRPAQVINTVIVRVKAGAKVGKRCQVVAQIERRTVIQALRYV
jgi:hypothetical protein